MLDAYIIDQIRRERENETSQRQPLRIEPPLPPTAPERGPVPLPILDDEDDSGIISIDNRVYDG
jgi:hypothetical protein